MVPVPHVRYCKGECWINNKKAVQINVGGIRGPKFVDDEENPTIIVKVDTNGGQSRESDVYNNMVLPEHRQNFARVLCSGNGWVAMEYIDGTLGMDAPVPDDYPEHRDRAYHYCAELMDTYWCDDLHDRNFIVRSDGTPVIVDYGMGYRRKVEVESRWRA